jgi:hypothetical protein
LLLAFDLDSHKMGLDCRWLTTTTTITTTTTTPGAL